jgi:hypothetical protein
VAAASDDGETAQLEQAPQVDTRKGRRLTNAWTLAGRGHWLSPGWHDLTVYGNVPCPRRGPAGHAGPLARHDPGWSSPGVGCFLSARVACEPPPSLERSSSVICHRTYPSHISSVPPLFKRAALHHDVIVEEALWLVATTAVTTIPAPSRS